MYIRVTKEFSFEMAHALLGYSGPCKNIHGHSYQLAVTMKGLVNTNQDSPILGMVIDFSKIKEIVKTELLRRMIMHWC
ncbi:MAG TPA: 6-carboxytetrahydropterin synthase [Bacteroidia bacterium]|jgi:6-pyruvoyltetrahydropterin/6-carboxytetrahydropterin synthase|nr:6-carboxytetrahydropterin synthase [Bacteroidia bacterium]